MIVLDSRLCQIDRNATLGHELIHEERGLLLTRATPPAMREKEEAIVRNVLARRLVPIGELERVVARLVDVEGCATAAMVAAEFQVPDPVAERAMRLLVERRAERRETG